MTVLAFVLVGLPAWGAIDAAARPEHHWETAGLSKRGWLALQAVGAPLGIGVVAALAYFRSARPKLQRAAVLSSVAVLGDELLARD